MPPPAPPSNRVVFNVGGRLFETYRSTIMRGPQTLLANLIQGPQNADADGSYFVDRDPDFFKYVLNWYRWGQVGEVPPEWVSQVVREWDYFRIPYSAISPLVKVEYKSITVGTFDCFETQRLIDSEVLRGWGVQQILKNTPGDTTVFFYRHPYRLLYK